MQGGHYHMGANMSLSGALLDMTTIMSNVTDNSTYLIDEPLWSTWLSMTFAVILSIIIFLSVFGNMLVISVVIRHKGMRTRTNMFLVNLAIADFMVGSLMGPFSVTTIIKQQWIFGDALCVVNGFLNCLCFVSSIHTLMYISIHKYISITRPFSRFLNVRRIFLMCCATWVWAGLCSVITVTGLQNVLYKKGTMQCGPSYPHNVLNYVHHVIIQLSDIFVPMGILIFAYVHIFKEIRAHSKRLRENTTLEKDIILAQQKKVTMTLFIVLAVYLTCWIPYHIYAMAVTFIKDVEKIPSFANPLAYLFGYLNSACNPIIYALRSPSFREGYKEILCRQQAFVVSEDDNEEVATAITKISDPLSLPRDTILEESPNPFRRSISRMWGSLKVSVKGRSESLSSLQGSRRGSQISLRVTMGSTNIVGVESISFNPKGSQRGRGNSIINKKDGTIIIMKDGKIVSVREQKPSRLRSEVYYPQSRSSDGSKTNSHVKENGKAVLESEPLLQNGNANVTLASQEDVETESVDSSERVSNISDDSVADNSLETRFDEHMCNNKSHSLNHVNSTSDDKLFSHLIDEESLHFHAKKPFFCIMAGLSKSESGLSQNLENNSRQPLPDDASQPSQLPVASSELLRSSSDTTLKLHCTPGIMGL